MNSLLIFLAGFISAMTLVGVLFIAGAIYWFLSYGRHIQQKKQDEAARIEQLNKRRVPFIGGNNTPL